MGRKPTVNLNMPPRMHPRRQRSGKTYYYLFTSDSPRKEIPLGSDFILALRKYADLNVIDVPAVCPSFSDLEKKYLATAVPRLAASTARMYASDIKHLLNSFKDAPLDAIKPMHIKKFLDKHDDKKTTANRCKRLFSTMWNHARSWGYTDLANPCEGIKGHSLNKRTVYITDKVFEAVYMHGSAPLRDAMDLAYLSGQRPGDALKMNEDDIVDGHLLVTQSKTKQPLRITINGKLAELIDRIRVRKDGFKFETSSLLVNLHGKGLTAAVLRNHFDEARIAAAQTYPELATEIHAFHFYDLRAKAADDTSAVRGEQAASDLLGHDSIRTTQRHYLRRGKTVAPTK